jgi:hypothetical protein
VIIEDIKVMSWKWVLSRLKVDPRMFMSGFGIPGIASFDTLPGVFLGVVEFYLFFMVFGVLFWWFGRSEFVLGHICALYFLSFVLLLFAPLHSLLRWKLS